MVKTNKKEHTHDDKDKSVCVVGMGYVGLTLALTLHDCGAHVTGVDNNESIVAGLYSARAHFHEAGLRTLLKRQLKNGFQCATSIPKESTVYIISVGTPVKDRRPRFEDLKRASLQIGCVLSVGDLVVLRSTVPVGVTREFVLPILEKKSKLIAGKDFSLSFAPERTIEGNALEELRTLPQIIAGLDALSIEKTKRLFKSFVPKLIVMDSLEEAEMVKLLANAYRDVSFAFANEFSQVCDAFNLHTNKIIDAANFNYPRGGVPHPSPGVGGYCLTKDPHIYAYSARKRGFTLKLSSHARKVNEAMPLYVYKQIMKFFNAHYKDEETKHVTLIGLAFKGNPPNSDMRFSPALDLARILSREKSIKVYGYDLVISNKEIDNPDILGVQSVGDAFKNKHCVVIMNNHKGHKKFSIENLHNRMRKPALFIDTWSQFDPHAVSKIKGISYSNLGYDSIST